MIPIQFKDEVARKYGYKDWQHVMSVVKSLQEINTTALLNMLEEACLLYCKSKEQEIERMREALKWYADDGNYLHNDAELASAWTKGRITEKAKRALKTPQPEFKP